ncbi:TRAP transporter small permease subunit [Iocasia frigidifontis]|uniref:TRAP transporter small permease subunit n=1 Tax=Iocasia fonsfrigidae TaxID=2682810 RepID=A0A8A7KLQ1_9FIRM|nr:TRAP transporter small permease [Iocasia fonsfrigidae]QTL99757.1 TRAP transporter small permease subunit [Iocasia fonsfrigidae]
MEKIIKCISRCADYLEQIVKVLTIFVLVVLITIVFFQVSRRIITSRSIIEIEEFSIVLASWLAFLSTAYAARKKVHVQIDVLTSKFPFTINHLLKLLINIMIMIACIVLTDYGFQLAERKMMIPMTVLPFKSGYWYISFPIGMIFTAFFTFDNILQELVLLKKCNN